MDNEFYSIKEFAHKLSVSERTIRRAVLNGRISAIRVGSTCKGAFRISHTELQRMATFQLDFIISKLVEQKRNEDK